MIGLVLTIIANVQTVCWVHSDGELFCNSPSGYDVIATSIDGTQRVALSGGSPFYGFVDLQLQPDETAITIRAR